MNIELYTRESCQACVRTKKLLTERNVGFTEYKLEHDIKREAVIERFPGVKKLPIVVVDGTIVASVETLFLNGGPNAE